MRRRWVWPLLMVLVWVFVGGPLGSFAGQLGSVQENDNAAFLPQTAESTQVLDTLTQFQEQETIPVTVVFQRDGGLEPADDRAVAAYVEELAQVEDVAGIQGPIPSEDGEAAQLVVQVATTDGEVLIERVDALRAVLDDAPEGLAAYVGGPGGILADLVNAFGAIDGLLLVVALVVVLVILVVVYRTPVLPFVVLFSAVLGLGLASAIIYLLASTDLLALNGQSQGILFILAIGAATDYSLLLVARFREELRDHESPYDAMRVSLRAVVEPIGASGATVILGLLCLLLSDLSSLQGLGPVGAIGVATAMLVSLTFLPAALVLLGRRAFWPLVPAHGSPHQDTTGVWARVAALVRDRSVGVAVVTTVVLAVLAGFAFTLDEDPVPQTDLFLTAEESVDAQDVLDEHFDADTASPLQIVVPTDQVGAAIEVLRADEGVSQDSQGPQPAVAPIPDPDDPQQPRSVDGQSIVLADLADGSETQAATETVQRLRDDLQQVDPDILVGGSTATLLDTRETTARDRAVVIPTILVVIFLVLVLLLRSLAAAGLLLVANVLSFGAALGLSAAALRARLRLPAPATPSTLLIAFVFLVALGIDYYIFLMTRVREESLRRGTRPGVLRASRSTGGVITSAGVVLAATFPPWAWCRSSSWPSSASSSPSACCSTRFVVRSVLVPSLSTSTSAPASGGRAALARAEDVARRRVGRRGGPARS